MADDTLPEQSPAQNGAAPQVPPSEPEAKPADSKPEAEPSQTPEAAHNPLDQLSDEEKTYLKGQKIEDLDSPEAIRKIINHAQSSQRQLSKLNEQFNKAGLKLEDKQTESANPLVAPPASSQPQAEQQPPSDQGLDPVTAYTLANNLATSFPELKDDLESGKFYTDMQSMGFQLYSNGQINLNGILAYGKFAQQDKQNQAKAEEMNKPGEASIPDANPTTPQQPADDADMDKRMAYAIIAHVAKGNDHPRSDEAKRFLQQQVVGAA
jgi:hypothetical protein